MFLAPSGGNRRNHGREPEVQRGDVPGSWADSSSQPVPSRNTTTRSASTRTPEQDAAMKLVDFLAQPDNTGIREDSGRDLGPGFGHAATCQSCTARSGRSCNRRRRSRCRHSCGQSGGGHGDDTWHARLAHRAEDSCRRVQRPGQRLEQLTTTPWPVGLTCSDPSWSKRAGSSPRSTSGDVSVPSTAHRRRRAYHATAPLVWLHTGHAAPARRRTTRRSSPAAGTHSPIGTASPARNFVGLRNFDQIFRDPAARLRLRQHHHPGRGLRRRRQRDRTRPGAGVPPRASKAANVCARHSLRRSR